MTLWGAGIQALEHGLVPDALARMAIRRLCRQRLRAAVHRRDPRSLADHQRFLESLRSGPIALVPEMANRQHYELPAEFFAAILGPHRKYSCCYFPDVHTPLADAEAAALELTCEHAEIADGQQILELGCGWGSLSLWMAERFPNSRITAVSNSASQRAFVLSQARARGLRNLQVTTADMNDFHPEHTPFDRVVSVEMFEHMRNLDCLLHRIASWLAPDGKLFVHIFCHRVCAYPFDTDGDANWMGKHFFTGGMMPSADLLKQFDHDLIVQKQYRWSGRHYQRTAEAWLANCDAHRGVVERILADVYGRPHARRWWHRWRTFFLAVSELFGFGEGEEWCVTHYLMEHAPSAKWLARQITY